MGSMSCSTNFQITSLTIEYRQAVINLLLSSFFLEEPVNAILKFEIPREPLNWTEFLVDQAIAERCSFIAVDRTTTFPTVVGVIINGISTREQVENSVPVESEKLKFIFSLIDDVTTGWNLFDIYGVDRLFHCDIINVDESQRGLHLSNQLISASMDEAFRLGIRAASTVCTSLFSRKSFERQGFQVIHEIPYSNYQLLQNMGLHDRCTLLARRLMIQHK